MRDIPRQAIELAKRFEGFHKVAQSKPVILAVPYLCPANYWTIGYGHLCKQSHEPITMEQGESYLAIDLQTSLQQTLALCPRLAVESNERLAAVIDFTFNLGAGRLKASTLRKRINEARWHDASNEMKKWVWGGGRKLAGLVIRRDADASLLLME